MTTVDDIMAEARKNADQRSQQPLRAPPGAERSVSPHARARNAPQPAGIRLTAEQLRARRSRSIAIALALGAFVLVIFAVTMVRLGSAALMRPAYMRPVQTTTAR